MAGAAVNRGLGHAFLRHISRAHALVYVLDAASGWTNTEGPLPWETARHAAGNPLIFFKQKRIQMLCMQRQHTMESLHYSRCKSFTQSELRMYSEALLRAPAIVLANKIDRIDDPQPVLKGNI